MSIRTGLNIERDTSERLNEDDTASLREAEFLQVALADQRRAAEQDEPVVRGVCTNCGEPLPPQWVYCDEDCREDHEARQRAARRHGLRK